MKTVLTIQNLKCGGCAHTIKNRLDSMGTITDVEVVIDENKVSFNYESEDSLTEVKRVLMSLGYPEQGQENTIGNKAKSYVSCAIGKLNS